MDGVELNRGDVLARTNTGVPIFVYVFSLTFMPFAAPPPRAAPVA